MSSRKPSYSPPDIHETLLLHMEASARLKELLKQIKDLRDARKLGQARKLMKDADELRERLEALTQHLRRKPPQRARNLAASSL